MTGAEFSATYRAVQVVGPGRLELVRKPVPVPGPDEVLIAVEACGLCGADRSDIEKGPPGRVPGHEAIGCIVAMGAEVPSIWSIGQRVGVGRFGGHCGTCAECRRGRFHLCRQQPVTGGTRDGGYAERMTARASGLVAIPASLAAEEAAPILCAGLATFNGLKHSGAVAGDTVAILGIGGLGHMAVQYARAMGFRTVALGRGQDIRDEALALGAHYYSDLASEDPLPLLAQFGGAAAILTTIAAPDTIAAVMPGLRPEGRLLLLGIGRDPLTVSTGFLVGGERSIAGSITGSPFEAERTLDFSLLTGVRPRVETLPLELAQQAYDRMTTGAAKFRMVLTMGEGDAYQ